MIIYKVSSAGARCPRSLIALYSLFSLNFFLQIHRKTRAHQTKIHFAHRTSLPATRSYLTLTNSRKSTMQSIKSIARELPGGSTTLVSFRLPFSRSPSPPPHHTPPHTNPLEFDSRGTWVIDGCCVLYRYRRQPIGRRGRGGSRRFWKASDWCRRWVPTKLPRRRGQRK